MMKLVFAVLAISSIHGTSNAMPVGIGRTHAAPDVATDVWKTSARRLFMSPPSPPAGGYGNPPPPPPPQPWRGKAAILKGVHCTELTAAQIKSNPDGGSRGFGSISEAETECQKNKWCAGVQVPGTVYGRTVDGCKPGFTFVPTMSEPDLSQWEMKLCGSYQSHNSSTGCIIQRPGYVAPPPPPAPIKTEPGTVCAAIQSTIPSGLCSLTACDIAKGITVYCAITDPLPFIAQFDMSMCTVPAGIKMTITQPTTHLSFKEAVTAGHTEAYDVPGLSMPYKVGGYGIDMGVVAKVSIQGSMSDMEIKVGLDACGDIKIPLISGHKCAENIPGLGSLFPINVLSIKHSFSTFCADYHGPTTFTTQPPSSTSVAPCVDGKSGFKPPYESCASNKDDCNNPKYATMLKKNCPKTCGACGTGASQN